MPSWKKVVVDGTSPSFSQITTTDITASGNISASGNVAGDVYLSKGIAAFTYNDPSLIFGNASYSTKLQGTNVLLSGQVTASGNISSSEDVLFKRLFISNERFVSNDGNDNVIGTGTHPTAINGAVGSSGYAVKISGETLFENNITASGNISSSGTLDVTGNVNFDGDLDVDGTTNLDAMDIDGNVQLDGTFTVGVNGTGKDVRFYGDTSNRYITWDQSHDQLKFQDNTELGFGTGNADAAHNVRMVHDGSNFKIESGIGTDGTTGQIQLIPNAAGALISGSGNTYLNVEGKISASGDLTGSGLYIRKNSPAANSKLLRIFQNASEKFFIDEDGDVQADGAIKSGDSLHVDIAGAQTSEMLYLEKQGTSAEQFYILIEEEGNTIFSITGEGDGATSNKISLDGANGTAIEGARYITTNGASSYVDITGTTAATNASGDTGALRVEGGASIAKNLFVGTGIVMPGGGAGNFLSASNGTLELSGSGAAFLEVQGNISASAISTGSLARLELVGGAISLKNQGVQSYINFYCESSNAHFVKLQAPAHSDFSGNVTVTLPTTTDTLVGKTTTDTLTNKTLTSPDINTPDIDGGTIDATPIGNSTAAEGNFTAVTASISISGSINSSGSFGHLKVGGNNFLGDPNTLAQIAEADAVSSDKLVLWDESVNLWKYITIDDLQDEIDTTGGGGGGISFDGSTANGVTTFKDSDEVTVEANLTFDGTTLTSPTVSSNRTFNKSSATDRNLAQGDVVYIGGGSTTLGDIVYMTTAGQWASAQADAVGTATSLLGIALGTDPDVDGVLLRGTYTLDHDVGNNQGIPLYLSDGTAGQATITKPDTDGDIVRIIGYNLGDDDEIWFNPDSTWVEVS